MSLVRTRLSSEARIVGGLVLTGLCGLLTILAIEAGSDGNSVTGLWLGAFTLGYPGLLLVAWGALALASPRVR
jgi:hypothetical protein